MNLALERLGFPVAQMVKSRPANAGDTSLIPGSGRSPGEGNGNLLQYACLESPMDRGAWWALVRGVGKAWEFSVLPVHLVIPGKAPAFCHHKCFLTIRADVSTGKEEFMTTLIRKSLFTWTLGGHWATL